MTHEFPAHELVRRLIEPAADGSYLARVHLEGNFPGGTVDLKYRFTLAADRISRLHMPREAETCRVTCR